MKVIKGEESAQSIVSENVVFSEIGFLGSPTRHVVFKGHIVFLIPFSAQEI